MLTCHIETPTVPEPTIIPSPWDDRRFDGDSEMNGFLNHINSQDQEDDEEDLDPTTIPVTNILIIYSKYIANILTG